MTNLFVPASQLRSDGRNYLIIHNEARSIENAILLAADSGLLDVVVYNTFMTQRNVNAYQNVTAINPVDNTFTINNHAFLTGDEVVLQTSGLLPTPLTAATTYYVIVVDTNTFKLANGFMDVVNNIPVDIINAGTGTMSVRKIIDAQKYFLTWQGQRKDRSQVDQMNAVISYFESLGYTIRRRTSPVEPTVFEWWISW